MAKNAVSHTNSLAPDSRGIPLVLPNRVPNTRPKSWLSLLWCAAPMVGFHPFWQDCFLCQFRTADRLDKLSHAADWTGSVQSTTRGKCLVVRKRWNNYLVLGTGEWFPMQLGASCPAFFTSFLLDPLIDQLLSLAGNRYKTNSGVTLGICPSHFAFKLHILR